MVVSRYEKRVEIPEGVTVTVEDPVVTVKGPKGELKKDMHYPKLSLSIEGNEVVIVATAPRKKHIALVGTYVAHLKNMITGTTEGFTYKMKAVHAHFPMTMKVQGKELFVDNYLGEKTSRKVKIFGDVNVKVKGSDVTIEGMNIEEVGQTAANIERATRAKGRDPRVFQDGIYLVERNGVQV